ncbi:hypothetical protein RchiOBHm_Chr2g0138701 [Rosa chinensis]|uniref:Uncharacterized protein n=1 Tax=Rosa chinensis TaxID=74649 RepID=A0A2P6RWZ7_ROSCH|nr:hypothetical protein RchiOBHm_Chr2g0138701 [Rosa chinensis]
MGIKKEVMLVSAESFQAIAYIPNHPTLCYSLKMVNFKYEYVFGEIPECGRPFSFGIEGGTCSLHHLPPRS